MTTQKEIKYKSGSNSSASLSILDYLLKWQYNKSKRWHNSKHKIALPLFLPSFPLLSCNCLSAISAKLSSLVTPSKMLYKSHQVLLLFPFHFYTPPFFSYSHCRYTLLPTWINTYIWSFTWSVLFIHDTKAPLIILKSYSLPVSISLYNYNDSSLNNTQIMQTNIHGSLPTGSLFLHPTLLESLLLGVSLVLLWITMMIPFSLLLPTLLA